jgi:aspartate 1-decarboxylase
MDRKTNRLSLWVWKENRKRIRVIRNLLKSKIHRATVTNSNIDYEGSCGICPELMVASDILPYELIHVWDVTNGERINTYAIPAPGVGLICIYGAAAHKIKVGDTIIIATYCLKDEKSAKKHKPKIISVYKDNKIRGID